MIKSLTSLRGIFIVFIFLHHCRQFYVGGGTMAVTFFFVLGGFSMALGYKDRVTQPEFCYKRYLTRRCIKFYPLHWICLFAALPLVSFSLWRVPVFFVNAALLQSLVPIKVVYFSFNSVSWYLADTMFFAILFPPLFKRIWSVSPKIRSIIAAFLTLLYVMVVFLLPSNLYHAILYINPIIRLFDFIFGIFLAIYYWKIKERPIFKYCNNSIVFQITIILIVFLLVIESCLLSYHTQMITLVYWPLVGLLILIASISSTNSVGGNQILENHYIQRLGELSFIIFLTHQLIIRYSKLLLREVRFFDNDFMFIIFTFILTIITSIVVEKYILKPTTQWLTKRNQMSMIARS